MRVYIFQRPQVFLRMPTYVLMYIFEHCCCIHYYFHLPQGSIVYKSLGVCNIRQTIWQTWVSLYSSACSSTWKNYIQKLAKKPQKNIYRYKMSNGFKKYLTIKRLTYTAHTYSVKPKLQQKCCKWWAILKLSSIKYLTRKCTFFVPSNI